MSRMTLLNESSEDLIDEITSRIADGQVSPEVAFSLLRGTIAYQKKMVEETNQRAYDFEIVAVAALNSKNATYGSLSRDEFILEKLEQYDGKSQMRWTSNDEKLKKKLGLGVKE